MSKEIKTIKKPKNYKKILIIILLSFITFCLVICSILQIGYNITEDNAYVWKPNYAMQDISFILDKEEISDLEYQYLYEQTGLTKIGIDRALKYKTNGKEKILKIQENYFKDRKILKEPFGPFSCTEFINGDITPIYLEKGDIVITSSTHFSFLKTGHSALVIDGENKKTIVARKYGQNSTLSSIYDFTNRINLMILRPRIDTETIEKVINYAINNLVGLPYNAFMGADLSATSIKETQCAHLVWFAYHKFGFELLEKSNSLVLPYDLAKSNKLELVQVYGFNPKTLWENLYF